MYKKYVKRCIDLILSVMGLIIISPILLITAVAIKIDSKGPIIFKQKRLGQYGKEFYIYINSEQCVSVLRIWEANSILSSQIRE